MKQETIAKSVSGVEKEKTGTAVGHAGKLLIDGAEAWRISQRTLILMWLIPFVVVFSAVASGLMGKEMYKLFTGEDRIAETLQVVFYLIAFVLNLIVIRRLWEQRQLGIGFLYIILCVGLFFMLGEELNWGQRFFGWETSEAFKAINKQKETNLHNIYGVGFTFKWVQLIAGAYGTVLPLLVFGLKRVKPYRQTLSFLVPHVTLIPFFMPLFMWRIYRNFFDAPTNYYFVIAEFNEVMELILAIGMALFMIYQYRRLKGH